MTPRETQPTGRDVRATVNYVRNRPPPGTDRLEFVTEDEARSTMRTTPGREVPIRDAREISTSIDAEGFELVSHASATTRFDLIEVDPDVDAGYCAETAEMISAISGASRS